MCSLFMVHSDGDCYCVTYLSGESECWSYDDIHVIMNNFEWQEIPLNPFPHNKILDQTRLKAFADDKIKCNKNDDFCL